MRVGKGFERELGGKIRDLWRRGRSELTRNLFLLAGELEDIVRDMGRRRAAIFDGGEVELEEIIDAIDGFMRNQVTVSP